MMYFFFVCEALLVEIMLQFLNFGDGFRWQSEYPTVLTI